MENKQASVNINDVNQLIFSISINYAERIKHNDCMYTIDCYQEYLKALADTLAVSPDVLANQLPIVQSIKNKVFGG